MRANYFANKSKLKIIAGLLVAYLILSGISSSSKINPATLNTSWENLDPINPPNGVYGHVMAYDSINKVTILFGGNQVAGLTNETWAYFHNNNTWIDMKPHNFPSSRQFAAMDFDKIHGVMILFGGRDASGTFLDDTWQYNYTDNDWTNLFPSNPPKVRYLHDMIYNSNTKLMVLIGGYNLLDSYLDDIWTYDYLTNSWVKTLISFPMAIAHHDMFYVNDTGRVYVIGGYNPSLGPLTSIYHTDINLLTWTLEIVSLPIGSYGMGTSYDTLNNKLVIHGGYNSPNTYLYDLSKQQILTVASGFAILYTQMVYNTENLTHMLFGGLYSGNRPNETLKFSLIDDEIITPTSTQTSIIYETSTIIETSTETITETSMETITQTDSVNVTNIYTSNTTNTILETVTSTVTTGTVSTVIIDTQTNIEIVNVTETTLVSETTIISDTTTITNAKSEVPILLFPLTMTTLLILILRKKNE